jgi:hypothetical protein
VWRAPCATEPDFHWDAIDAQLMQYVSNTTTSFDTGCAHGQQCKIVLIVQPVADSGNDNTFTPKYVFSSAYASSLAAPPQDVAVCSNMQGGSAGWSGAPPVTGTFGAGDYATWNVNGGTVASGSDVSFGSAAFPTTNFSGYPVQYEVPIATAYQHFIAALLQHYSSSGTGNGPALAKYIAYIRIGFHGGEDDPSCASDGQVPSTPWTAGTTIHAGDLIQPVAGNANGYYFVANSDGTTGSAAPAWCQTYECTTAGDGGVSSWRNTGLQKASTGSAAAAMWPAPDGTAHGFTDANYLSFTHGIYAFAAAQHSTIPLDIASHDGPPFNGNWAFADAAAVAAASDGIGFGNEGMAIDDIALFESGAIPSSLHDWVENFTLFAHAPIVRHLQMAWPGGGLANGAQAEAFEIEQIVVANGVGTATCSSDCSALCGPGGLIPLTGTANGTLDGTWKTSGSSCATDHLALTMPGIADGTYNGGSAWASDYLPATLAFGVAHGATTFELHECTLDYAFGVETVGTQAHSCQGDPGPGSSYQAAIAAIMP